MENNLAADNPELRTNPAQADFPEASRLRSRDIFRLLVRAWPFVRPYRRHLLYLFLLMVIPALPIGLFAINLIRITFD
ncbi:MAG TPA: hypothetical protein VIX12_07620, partial [Candidatus Binataceae bacterium]